MKKLLQKGKAIICISAGADSLPFIIEAQKQGLVVIATDIRVNAPGLTVAQERIIASSLDHRLIIKKLERLHKKYDFCGVITRSSPGRAAVTAAYVAKHYGLPWIEPQLAEIFVNKGKFIKSLARHRIPVPRSEICTSFKQANNFLKELNAPVVIKPSIPTVSRTAIRKIDNEQQLRLFFSMSQKISLDSKVEIEEYLDGPELISIDLVKDGKIYNLLLIDELTTPPPYFINLFYRLPSNASRSTQNKVSQIVTKMVFEFGIEFGMLSTAFRITSAGPKVIESHIDLGGDEILDRVIPAATGINIIGELIKFFAGGHFKSEPFKIKPVKYRRKAKKVLVLGCNYDQIPYLIELKKRGYFLVGTDLNSRAPGIKCLNRYYRIGYEDEKGLISVGKKEGFSSTDKVFTAAAQFAYIGASKFAKHFKIDFVAPKTVDICLNKHKLYSFLKAKKVPIPPTKNIETKRGLINNLEEGKQYFLKSDFSKNPQYIYRLAGKNIPSVNWQKDRYFRKYYVLQESILGQHLRVNYFAGQFFCFHKITDKKSFALRNFKGLDISKLEKSLSVVIEELKLEKLFVKFDVIVRSGVFYVIDIGLDPPMRYYLLLKKLKYSFAELYVSHYLENSCSYPDKKDLLRKKIMIGN